jgi:hypothetical protein
MLAKMAIALSTALALAAASTAIAMTNPNNPTLPRAAVSQKSTTAAAHRATPASLAHKAWLDRYRLGFGT